MHRGPISKEKGSLLTVSSYLQGWFHILSLRGGSWFHGYFIREGTRRESWAGNHKVCFPYLLISTLSSADWSHARFLIPNIPNKADVIFEVQPVTYTLAYLLLSLLLLIEYRWQLGDWNTCSATCGNSGTQFRKLLCVGAKEQEVNLTLCDESQKPTVNYQSCNTHDCPARYTLPLKIIMMMILLKFFHNTMNDRK